MSLVQIHCKRGIVRYPSDYRNPEFLELHLDDNQRIISLEWKHGSTYAFERGRRKTVDWYWTVWIETRL